jgi:hypothetical protein
MSHQARISAAWIDRARSQRVESECAGRDLRLKRVSAVELAGPCPVCGGDDRFSINTRKQVWNCRGCGKGGDIIDLVQHLEGCDFERAITTLVGERSAVDRTAAPSDMVRIAKEKTAAAERERAERLRLALHLWKRHLPIADSAADTYLRCRGYRGSAPGTLGFLPAIGKHPPALIGAFGLAHEIEPGVIEIADDAVRGIHLTRLRPDGSDRERGDRAKIMIGLSTGWPIVIAPPNDSCGLSICEGIEDGLSVYQATGHGVWVAGAAGRMPALATAIPSYVEVCAIWAHKDEAGQAGARALAEALDRRGIEVRIANAGRKVRRFTSTEVLERIEERDRLGVTAPIAGGRHG